MILGDNIGSWEIIRNVAKPTYFLVKNIKIYLYLLEKTAQTVLIDFVLKREFFYS